MPLTRTNRWPPCPAAALIVRRRGPPLPLPLRHSSLLHGGVEHGHVRPVVCKRLPCNSSFVCLVRFMHP